MSYKVDNMRYGLQLFSATSVPFTIPRPHGRIGLDSAPGKAFQGTGLFRMGQRRVLCSLASLLLHGCWVSCSTPAVWDRRSLRRRAANRLDALPSCGWR